MKTYDMIIIGGGSAGMSAAVSAKAQGIRKILILERSEELGGILQQCIHNGFGLQIFHEEMSGPLYAQTYKEKVDAMKIEYKLNTTVVSVNAERIVTYVNEQEGYQSISGKTIIFASGCYERNRGAISIPGKRIPGVYTAGSAQRFLNLENILVGKKVFILGSGDIGLIMARRMSLEGATVEGVAELMPYSNGLTRNIVQCLHDFNIPLYLSHTVVDIKGTNHVEGVTIAQVDEHKQPISGTEKTFDVDTLLLSVGLIPENELGYQMGIQLDAHTKGASVNGYYETSVPHVYACGNALHVHDIVDFVSQESADVGYFAAMDILKQQRGNRAHETIAKQGVGYVLPQVLSDEISHDVILSFRCSKPFKACQIIIQDDTHIIKKITKRYLLPAEMERIKLKKDDLQNISGKLSVEVQAL